MSFSFGTYIAPESLCCSIDANDGWNICSGCEGICVHVMCYENLWEFVALLLGVSIKSYCSVMCLSVLGGMKQVLSLVSVAAKPQTDF